MVAYHWLRISFAHPNRINICMAMPKLPLFSCCGDIRIPVNTLPLVPKMNNALDDSVVAHRRHCFSWEKVEEGEEEREWRKGGRVPNSLTTLSTAKKRVERKQSAFSDVSGRPATSPFLRNYNLNQRLAKLFRSRLH